MAVESGIINNTGPAVVISETGDVILQTLAANRSTRLVSTTGEMRLTPGATSTITGSGANVAIGTTAASGGTISFNNGPAGANSWFINSVGQLAQNSVTGDSIFLFKNQTAFYQTVGPALTATGTVLADSLQLNQIICNVTTVALGTGVRLWELGGNLGHTITVINNGANALNVYPHNASGNINGAGPGVARSLATTQMATFTYVATNVWVAGVMTKL